MKTRLLFVPLLLVLVASLAACGGGQSVPANAIAVVNGSPITQAQFNAVFTQAVNIVVAQGQPKPTAGTAQYTTLRNQVVAYLVQFEEMKQQAPRENVTVTNADVDKFLANLAKTNFHGNMKKLWAALKKQGFSEEAARRQVYITLLTQKIKAKVTSSAKVTDAQEQQYYKTNIQQYSTQASTTRSVGHILVKSKSLADKIEQKLKNGASFAKMAEQYSQDHQPGQPVLNGGTYTATKGQDVPAFDAVAFSLKTGELSPPVDATSAANNKYGWFIIKALAPIKNTPAHTTPFKDAKASIEQALLAQQQTTLWQQWLSDLQKEYQGKVSYQSGYAPPTTTALPTTVPPVTTG